MSTGLKANNDGSAAIQVGGTDYIQISSTGNVTIPQSQTISGNLTVTGTATVGGQPVGGDYVMLSYVSPATWTKPAGLKAVKVTVVGAGGNGGNFPATPAGTASGNAGSGGGGGTAIEYLDAPAIPGPVAVTAGPGTNSFGAFCSATAGGAGTAASGPSTSGTNGAGGTGSGGTFNINGGDGINFSGSVRTTIGGASSFSNQAITSIVNTGGTFSNGTNGNNYGGGGTGALKISAPVPSSVTGGTGAPGIVIVEEFY